MENTPKYIIIHHTAWSNMGRQFLEVNKWHKDRDFLKSSYGYHCGYHRFIEKDGTIKIAKKDNEVGCHCIGKNTDSIGIALAGNFTTQTPTQVQMDQVTRMCSELMKKYNIPVTNIKGHKAFSQTLCPGVNMVIKDLQYNTIIHEPDKFKKILMVFQIFFSKN